MERLFGASELGKRDKWRNRPGYRATTIQKAVARCADVYDKERPSAIVALPGAVGSLTEHWELEEVVSDQGKLIANAHNVAVRFLTDARLEGRLAFDEMAGNIVVAGLIPGGSDDSERPLNDSDIVQLQTYLQTTGFPRIGKDAVFDGALKAANKRTFHPVRRYLQSVTWDGVSRLSTWLVTYCGASDWEYTQRIGRMWMVSAVARIIQPGCKADAVIVLEGPQNAGKSMIARILGGDWFSDALPDIRHGSKDLAQHLAGKWIIEIAELASMSKADDRVLKGFLSKTEEQYRRPYARVETKEPRQCVFIGTTNRDDYLHDETGSRRFWPVKVGAIDLPALRRDRDQLFAEAVSLYRNGVPHWPDAELAQLIAKEGSKRTAVGDPWDEAIAEHLAAGKPVTVGEVLKNAILLTEATMSTEHQRRVIRSLARLGWRKGPRMAHGQLYVPPPPEAIGHLFPNVQT
jgi:predicted P-loop ATPase